MELAKPFVQAMDNEGTLQKWVNRQHNGILNKVDRRLRKDGAISNWYYVVDFKKTFVEDSERRWGHYANGFFQESLPQVDDKMQMKNRRYSPAGGVFTHYGARGICATIVISSRLNVLCLCSPCRRCGPGQAGGLQGSNFAGGHTYEDGI